MRTTLYRFVVAGLDLARSEVQVRPRVWAALVALRLTADQLVLVARAIETDFAAAADERWEGRRDEFWAWLNSLELAARLRFGSDQGPTTPRPALRLVGPCSEPEPQGGHP